MNEKMKGVLALVDAIAMALLFLIFASGLALLLHGRSVQWVDLLFDDGYYYLGLARSLAETGFSAYLPPYSTNGYQPLWLMLLSASAWVFGTSDASLVIQSFTWSFIFVGAFSFACKRRYGHAFPAIASCTIYAYITLDGMETAMMPLFVLGFFSAKKWTSKGLLSSLLFLTRLDALAFIVINDGYRFFIRKECDLRHYAILIPVALVYFASNYFLFGIPVPVSGLSKSVGNQIGENISIYYSYIETLLPAFTIMLCFVIFKIGKNENVKIEYLDEILIAMLAIAGMSTYYALMSGWPLWGWYFWPALIAYFYAVLSALSYLKKMTTIETQNHRQIASIVMVGMVFLYTLVPAGYFVLASAMKHKKILSSYGAKNIELVDYIRANNIPPGTIFAMGDRAGSFGFFLGSQYKFLHTEGLVGPTQYYEAMKIDQGADFLRKSGAKYLIADREVFLESADTIGVVEPVQGMSAHHGPYMLCFDRKDIVLAQSYFKWANNERYMFDLQKEVACPAGLSDRFNELRSQYGALRKFTFPSDYAKKRGALLNYLNGIVPFPPGL